MRFRSFSIACVSLRVVCVFVLQRNVAILKEAHYSSQKAAAAMLAAGFAHIKSIHWRLGADSAITIAMALRLGIQFGRFI